MEFIKTSDVPVVLAPMVEMCDLPFRLLVRQYGIVACWTGMINAKQWNTSKTYRNQILQLNEKDKPLVCQISGSIDSDLLKTAKDISSLGNPIDINLGCCQKVAKRGGYGYFMVDNEEKRQNVIELIKEISSTISVPLFVKIRELVGEDGLPNAEITADFASKLEDAGAALITVHARPATQDKNGPINVDLVKAVVSKVKIPIIINGGINSLQQAKELIKETGASAAMSAQGLLKDPSAFDPTGPKSRFDIAKKYLDIYDEVGGSFEAARRHMFYIFDKDLGTDNVSRARLGKCVDTNELRKFIVDVENGLIPLNCENCQ